MTANELKALVHQAVAELGLTKFECDITPGPEPCQVTIITTPLTLYERDEIYAKIRDHLPVHVSAIIRPVKGPST